MLFSGERGGGMGTERGQLSEEIKKRVHNAYINPVPVSYLLLVLLCYMFKRTHSAARHSTENEGQGARRCTALRCAAELYIAGLT